MGVEASVGVPNLQMEKGKIHGIASVHTHLCVWSVCVFHPRLARVCHLQSISVFYANLTQATVN